MVEPLQQRGRLEDAHARRGQLERERQAVEAAADRGDRRGIRCGEREAGLHLLGALDEECDRRALPQRLQRRRVLRRQLERRQTELRLRADLERRAARRDHLQRGAARDERGDVSRGIEHLLEIVEHQEHAAIADDRAERVERRTAVRLGDVERDGDRRQHLGGHGDRGERDERRATGVVGRQTAEELDRETRLAGAAVAGDGEHARAAAQAFGGGREVLLAAEQGRGRGRRRLRDRCRLPASAARGAVRCRRRARSGSALAVPSRGSARRCGRGRPARRLARSPAMPACRAGSRS